METTIKEMLAEIIINTIFIICVYFLWNWLMPNLIMAKQINILEAWGLRTLAQFCTWHKDYNKK